VSIGEIKAMNGLFAAAMEAQQFMQSHGWRFCIIGGLAVLRWGRPRVTQDVDFSVLAEFGKEPEFVDALLGGLQGRISDAREFALESRVVLCKASNGVALDVALAGFPYEEQVIARASVFAFAPGTSLITASAEDLLTLKAFAGRDQDWADVQGIIERQADKLDWDSVRRNLKELGELQEGQDAMIRLEEIRQRLDSDSA
jgi:hypothetical protein